LEKLGESGEANEVRSRHRDHYTALAALVDAAAAELDRRVAWAETEIDNLRGAFTWSRESSDVEAALELCSALHPLWIVSGRIQEGMSWFDGALSDTSHELAPATWARAIADRAALDTFAGLERPDSLELAEQALAIARDIGDPALTVRALTACGAAAVFLAVVTT